MFRHTTQRGSVRRAGALFAIASLVAVVFMAAAARGQLIPLVPDPITTPELMGCADALGLSAQQRLQLLSLHDDYKQRYRQFQDQDIRKLQDALLDIVMRFTRGLFSIPQREELEDLLDQYRRVHAKSQTIDRTLFDSIASILAEDQMPALERARTNRALATYQAVVFELVHELNQGAGVNLAELVRGLDCLPDEIAQTDLILPGYEGAMLRKARNIYGVLNEATTVILDTVDELGLRDMTPEEMMGTFQDEQVQQSLMTTFDEASRPLQTAAFELSQLNLTTFHRLLLVLSESNAADLRDRYYRRAYWDAYRGPGAWRDRFRRALELDGLDDSRCNEIAAQRDDFARQDDQLADNLVRTAEASREYRTFSQFSGMQPDKDEERIDMLRERRQALGASADAALNALLGPELTARLDGPDAKEERHSHSVRIQQADGTVQTITVEDGEDAGAADREQARAVRRLIDDPLLAPPMEMEDVELLAARLGWGDDETTVLSTLHDDYLEEYDRLRTAPIEDEPAADEERAAADEAEAIWALFEALCDADDRFFDGAGVLAADESPQRLIKRHRAMRRRHVLTNAARKTAWMFSVGDDGFVDLVSIIAHADISDAARTSLQLIEDGYEAQVTPLIRDRLDAARKAHRRMTMARDLRQRGNPAAGRLSEAMMEKWREAQDEARDCNKQIVRINRETLEQVLAKLTDDAAWVLRYEYNREAYPDIFDDDESAEDALAATYRLEDLTPPQRQRVNELASDFRRDYFELSRRMVELRRHRDFDIMSREGPRREDIEREIELARLSYDRDELSARARTHLRLILTEEQVQRTGELKRRGL